MCSPDAWGCTTDATRRSEELGHAHHSGGARAAACGLTIAKRNDGDRLFIGFSYSSGCIERPLDRADAGYMCKQARADRIFPCKPDTKFCRYEKR